MEQFYKLGGNVGGELHQLLSFLEGPTALRVAGGVAGLALAAGAIFTAVAEQADKLEPSLLILRAYTVLFGLIVIVNELKTPANANLETFRNWTFKWFPFMSVMAGKGVFMLLVGSVGMAYQRHYMVLIPATVLALTGCGHLFVYWTKRREVGEAVDKSMNILASHYYPDGQGGNPPYPRNLKDYSDMYA
eukprot:Protomagalhaensia_wolfi_Nauph_80__1763@NODE_209_length_3171_cov_19_960089_g157_i0_p3_GENE_NODE_209_length_3171_cov_19_960089_g157_i0NODE_209_length_3171_cov_19_960089_g157_i0_p3_ORF_typecomplete_len190_score27_96COPI_assoc/PF08507_10/6_4e13DUF2613/PF11021_8/0_074CbiQ/PF02361_16/0_17CoA_binding_3/PF13727_6/4_6e02CoA_binding_3/PF13727_6/1_2Claudin_2/PF13903_6/2_8e03Claudin_2/PF13903_6/0_25_NODE_209_length_3171_cov_19_960089_g157_i09171486